MKILETEAAAYPLISVHGPARERGIAYGQQTAHRIAKTLSAYRALFAWYAQIDWATATKYALRYEPFIRSFDSQLVEEMEGISEGAEVAFEDILAINVRTEIMYGLGEIHAADCTAFTALPEVTRDSHTLLGQNWDWHPSALDCCVVLAMTQPDRPSIVTVVEAGLLAKMGMNSEGLGVVTNAMVSNLDQGAPGIPYHVMLRTLLNCRTLEQAIESIKSAQRASSANYLIATKDGVAIDLEVAPGREDYVFEIGPVDGVLGHANCFVAPDVTVRDETNIKKPLSRTRQTTIDEHLEAAGGSLSVEGMMSVMADHNHRPNSLCRHPVEQLDPMDRSATVASVIMDLTECRMWVADGQPCNHPYRELNPRELWANG